MFYVAKENAFYRILFFKGLVISAVGIFLMSKNKERNHYVNRIIPVTSQAKAVRWIFSRYRGYNLKFSWKLFWGVPLRDRHLPEQWEPGTMTPFWLHPGKLNEPHITDTWYRRWTFCMYELPNPESTVTRAISHLDWFTTKPLLTGAALYILMSKRSEIYSSSFSQTTQGSQLVLIKTFVPKQNPYYQQ